jgi:hypothetical protein
MKVALKAPGEKYDIADMRSWKIDLEKAFTSINPVTTRQPTSFTPTMFGSTTAGAPTYTTQFGEYSQIDYRVFFNLIVTISAVGGMVGQLGVRGLPIPARNVALGYHEIVARWGGFTMAANYTAIAGRINAASSDILLDKFGSAGVAAAALNVTETGATASLLLSGSYSI